ncbi:MAG: hypothetical protein ACLRQF_23065 [Thomasclavelia ramosa]
MSFKIINTCLNYRVVKEAKRKGIKIFVATGLERMVDI